jgi:cysteine synthase A
MQVSARVTDLIGDTPLVRLDGFAENLLAKVEGQNPGGSVKDRIGDAMLEAAADEGALGPDTTVIEPTSGNTGIGLAMAAAARDLDCVLVMPESMSEERRALMCALGAEIVLSDADGGMGGAVDHAKEMVEQADDAIMPQQFLNPANPEIPRRTTGPEIWEATDGEIDTFVAGVGTGGTITGVAQFLDAETEADVDIVAIEPADSAVLSGEQAGSHGIQGIGAGFVPDVLEMDHVDEIRTVHREDAVAAARRLASGEGVLAGISAGAAVDIASDVAAESPDDTVVTVLPDVGERYLSTDLFEADAVQFAQPASADD